MDHTEIIFQDKQFDEESVDMNEDEDIGFDEDDEDNMEDEWDQFDDEDDDYYYEVFVEEYDDDDEYYNEEDEWGVDEEDDNDYSWLDNLGQSSIDDQGSQDRIQTVKLKIPGKLFLKVGCRTSVTFKL